MYISNFLMYIICSLTVDREIHLFIFDIYNIVITSVKLAVRVIWFNTKEHWYSWVLVVLASDEHMCVQMVHNASTPIYNI